MICVGERKGMAETEVNSTESTSNALDGRTLAGPEVSKDSVVKVFRQDDTESQNILKAISNQSTLEIYQELLTMGPLRLSDIAVRFDMSVNAAKYHIDNLERAGLIEIVGTKYSRKGRKMNIYKSKNFIFLFSPSTTGREELLSLMLKYCTALGIFSGTFAFLMVQPFFAMPEVSRGSLSGSMQPSIDLTAYDGGFGGVFLSLILTGIVTLVLMSALELFGSWKKERAKIRSS
jgi:predicted transcriptional regulator